MKPGEVLDVLRGIIGACINHTEGVEQFCTGMQALAIIECASRIIDSEPAVLELAGDFAVVGDIHGSIRSLTYIFENLGYPDQQAYLFLGDYVDRGPASCEVMLILYALKILYPTNIYLLRGNHECRSITEMYGFQRECTRRFPFTIYDEFIRSFSKLPLAAILNDRVFCVHGGISPSMSSRADIMKASKFAEGMSDCLEDDMLWSDPSSSIDLFEENSRGKGCKYGKKAVNSFFARCKFETMIRSHESCKRGSKWALGGSSCLTIFSAIDYCSEGNDGAVAILEEMISAVEIVKFSYDKAYKQRNVLLPRFLLEDVSCGVLPRFAEHELEHVLPVVGIEILAV